ncbi:hypothetical protein [Bailinhaonella thermotolerans]|uniref:Uncharacterized protein n=1 Tax=Bailinhaonella thermotolerans TaxID=1070861 RepID=A0A3A4ATB2_9ACTN|nr:hypothetical protein [Bailinhaonella thermotolerans]RJL32603.1 hypothetical protein D5H75_13910 [Bailinhaonella thermotolerans]
MSNAIRSLADRVASKLVPQVRAGACCPPDPFYQYRCTGGIAYRRRCSQNCGCSTFCGPWEQIGGCA